MDVLSDALVDGRVLRESAVIDDFSLRCVSMEFDAGLPAERVTRILDRAVEAYGTPKRIRTVDGLEFASKAFNVWCYTHGIEHLDGGPGDADLGSKPPRPDP